MKFGLLSRGVRKTPFTPAQLPSVIKSLEAGEADWLQLQWVRSDQDWVRSYEDHLGLSWQSVTAEPRNRPLSPIEKRFGTHAGSLVATYPLSRFAVGFESVFQKKLLQLVRLLISEHGIFYSFIHEGFRPKRPASVGEDDVFLETLDGFPLTSFDADLDAGIFFKEFAKGAFWANFLNPFHVNRLGGFRRIRKEHPTSMFERIGDDRILLQVGVSPLPENYENASQDYQRLRRFLKPILLETPKEKQRFQMSIIGSWRPSGYDANWKKVTTDNMQDDSSS